jgi:hypothetical protein
MDRGEWEVLLALPNTQKLPTVQEKEVQRQTLDENILFHKAVTVLFPIN